MIPEPGDADHEVPVNETFHEQTDDELTEKELKQVEADDQAIQTILLGLPKDIYAAVNSYCTTGYEFGSRQTYADGWRLFSNAVQIRAFMNVENRNGRIVVRLDYNQKFGYLARNCIVRLRRRDTAYLQTQLLIAQKEEASIQIQDEEFDLMAAAADT
ncbi:hypothetical protein Tco_1502478 [Tanacetum coccineum]